MSVELGSALKQARRSRGLTAKVVGSHVGVSAAAVYQWESGATEPETDNLIKVADLLGIDPLAAKRGDVANTNTPSAAGKPPDPPPDIILPPPGQERAAPAFDRGNRDVPMKGVSVGGTGDEADFSFNGETIDYVRRPPGIATRKDVFAVELMNDSMAPAREHGDPLFIDTHGHPRTGEDVIVELHGEGDQAGAAYVKRLVRRSASKVVVKQFNPPKEIEFDARRVKKLWRIFPVKELLVG